MQNFHQHTNPHPLRLWVYIEHSLITTKFSNPTFLDPLEVDTADKLVLVALDDGSVRGIHLGLKKEVHALNQKHNPETKILQIDF